MSDNNGFDPDKTYLVEDNEFWDCTDAAHPAWWRGTDHGVKMVCSLITKVLDHELPGTVSSPELYKVLTRIYRLVESKNKC